jgi:antibiotic biosynthesis monooxygenase (ABM) superfamily enzyme
MTGHPARPAAALPTSPGGPPDSLPSRPPGGPKRWKLWLLTVCGIYPVITILATLTGPVLGGLVVPLRLAVLIPVAVAAMVWIVMPALTRRFGAWLVR